MRKLIVCILIVTLISISVIACVNVEGTKELLPIQETAVESPEASGSVQVAEETGQEKAGWSIYWYLCGSDLETDHGAATGDLNEMLAVELPEGVQVIIQTGGANEWQNDYVDPELSQRFIYDSDGFRLIEEQEKQNMGEPETLSSFIEFGLDKYPAENSALIFWNHGGGSLGGFCYDEQYEGDRINLTEMKTSLSNAFKQSGQDMFFDMVGFDACFMATLDTGAVLKDYSDYLVASEDIEPRGGWQYTAIMQALTDNPNIPPEDLGKVICDSYKEENDSTGEGASITLSMVDLSELDILIDAYSNMGWELLDNAIEDPTTLVDYFRIASMSENYGLSSQEDGYHNMVDLGDMATKGEELFPNSSKEILEALDDVVSYSVNGEYRQNSNGVSVYHSYDSNVMVLETYEQISEVESINYLYRYALTGELPQEAYADYEEYFSKSIGELLPVPTMNIVEWANIEPVINEDGFIELHLGEDAKEVIYSLGFALYDIAEEADYKVLLGYDNDMSGDWETGVFVDNFRMVWGSIDGNILLMELVAEEDTYNRYSVPILLNGNPSVMQVVYDFEKEEYIVIGAIEDSISGESNKMQEIAVGDEITPRFSATLISDPQVQKIINGDAFTIKEDSEFYEQKLPDGIYQIEFVMNDIGGKYAVSEAVQLEIIDGELFVGE